MSQNVNSLLCICVCLIKRLYTGSFVGLIKDKTNSESSIGKELGLNTTTQQTCSVKKVERLFDVQR